MLPGIGSPFESATQSGPVLEVELISAHARVSGTVSLGAYARLSDLLNFHDEILTVNNAVVLNRRGIATADAARQLGVHLDTLTLVIDRSNYVPPPGGPDAVQTQPIRVLAITEDHVITATMFIHPDAEPVPYLRASEPRWLPVTNVRVRSLVDRRVKFQFVFGVLHRKAVSAAAVL